MIFLTTELIRNKDNSCLTTGVNIITYVIFIYKMHLHTSLYSLMSNSKCTMEIKDPNCHVPWIRLCPGTNGRRKTVTVHTVTVHTVTVHTVTVHTVTVHTVTVHTVTVHSHCTHNHSTHSYTFLNRVHKYRCIYLSILIHCKFYIYD